MLELQQAIDQALAQFDIPGVKEAIKVLLDEPSDLYNQAADTDNDTYLSSLFRTSTLQYGFGNVERGLEGWLHYIDFSQKNGILDQENYAQTLLYVGTALEELDKPSEAMNYYTKYLTYVVRHLNAQEQALGFYRQGKVQMVQGLYTEALQSFLKIQPLKEGIENELLIDTKSALATAYIRLGDFVKGEQIFDQIDRLLEKTDDNLRQIIAITNNKAILYQELYQYEKAIVYFKKLIVWEKERNQSSESLIRYLNNLALAYHEHDKADEGLACLKEALSLAAENLSEVHPRKADLFNNYGVNLLGQGKIYEALDKFKQCETVLNQLEENEHLKASLGINLAVCFIDLNQPQKALEYLKDSQAILNNLFPKYHHEHTDLLLHKCLALEKSGHIDKAHVCLQQARGHYQQQIALYFTNLSQAEKDLFYFSVFHFYELYISFLLRIHQNEPLATELCFELTMESKSFVLNEAISLQQSIRNTESSELKRKAQSLYLLKQKLYRNKKTSTNLYKDSLDDLRRLEKELSIEMSLPTTMSATQVKNALLPKEILIEVFRINYYENGINESVKYLFYLVDTDTVRLIIEDDHQYLESEGANLYFDTIYAAEQRDSKAWNSLWKPIWERVKKPVKDIWFIPDGLYHRINPETLFCPDKKKYLTELTNFRHLTSTRDLINIRSYTNSTPPAIKKIAMYYPMNEKSRADFLPGGQAEMDHIRSAFKNVIIDCFEGKDANGENLLKTTQPHILHIITHGYYNQRQKVKAKLQIHKLRGIDLPFTEQRQSMFNSGLMMYPVDQVSELTAYEVSTMDLNNTLLVTLSACESALGDLVHGAGAYGLIRAFRMAGAKNIIASLWKVSDEVTSFFMEKFYQAFADHFNVTKAFKTAQLQTMQSYPAPYYWGAFKIYTG